VNPGRLRHGCLLGFGGSLKARGGRRAGGCEHVLGIIVRVVDDHLCAGGSWRKCEGECERGRGAIECQPRGSLWSISTILETFTRPFVGPDALDDTVVFYKVLLNGQETLRFAYPEAGLTLAAVSSPRLSVLVIAGEAGRRRPFEVTALTIKASALEEFVTVLRAGGAEQLEPIQKTPVGRKTRFRHADGLVVEYVDHDAS